MPATAVDAHEAGDSADFAREVRSVCPYCGGDAKDCEACRGFGFLNKDSYEAAPKELKHDSQ